MGRSMSESVPVFSPPPSILTTIFDDRALNTVGECHVGASREIRENGEESVAVVMGRFLSRICHGGGS